MEVHGSVPDGKQPFVPQKPGQQLGGLRVAGRIELTPGHWRTDYRTVEFVTRAGAPNNTRASFVLESGTSTLNKA